MGRKRKHGHPGFKARVALETTRERETIRQWVTRQGVRPS